MGTAYFGSRFNYQVAKQHRTSKGANMIRLGFSILILMVSCNNSAYNTHFYCGEDNNGIIRLLMPSELSQYDCLIKLNKDKSIDLICSGKLVGNCRLPRGN